MTVEEAGGLGIACVWFEARTLHRGLFAPDTLKRYIRKPLQLTAHRKEPIM